MHDPIHDLSFMPRGLKAPKSPKRLTVASLGRYKANLRAYDAARVAAGVDPSLITRENSFIPPGPSTLFLNRVLHPAVARLLAAEKSRAG